MVEQLYIHVETNEHRLYSLHQKLFNTVPSLKWKMKNINFLRKPKKSLWPWILWWLLIYKSKSMICQKNYGCTSLTLTCFTPQKIRLSKWKYKLHIGVKYFQNTHL